MRRGALPVKLTIRQAYFELSVDQLKSYAALLGEKPTRKADLVGNDRVGGVLPHSR
jgi:hypothetical protein